jgi:diguanylate cyclase (GGDEF)-like protein/PAS domain S-box-containing protein
MAPPQIASSAGHAPYAVLEHNPSLMTVKDERSRYVYANKRAREVLKLRFDASKPPTDADIFDTLSARRAVSHDRKALRTGASVEYHAELCLVDGSAFPAHVVKSVIAGPEGTPLVVTAIYNQSELSSARQAALDAERRFETLVESAPYGILLLQQERVVYSNSEAANLLCFAAADDLLGREYASLLAESTRQSDEACPCSHGAQGDYLECAFKRQDGTTLDAEVFKRLVPYGGETAILVHIRDISERKQHNERLETIARRDALTGLPNRHHIQEAAQAMVVDAQRAGQPAALVFIDLDHFKRINDTHGHASGDALIRLVATRLSGVLRRADAIGRLGGDEFVVLLDNTNRAVCERIVQRILDVLRAPFVIDGVEMFSGASLGVAMFPEAGTTVAELLQAADTAMYRAKGDGRFTYRFFEPSMNAQAQLNLWLDTNLRHGLAQGQFKLYYQPKVDARTGEAVGLEALVRWMHPERGLVSPADFIPFAEESGLIVSLGDWVIEEACLQISKWRKLGLDIPVAVNLSAKQLGRHAVVSVIKRALDEHQVPAELLELELTESAFIEDEQTAHALLAEFKALGCKLYLDDFGTGYSSLSQLSRLSLDAFKIDRSFVSSMTIDPQSAALVESMAHIARALKLNMVAEGVETQEQLDQLRRMGVVVVQGYLFAKPMPADQVPTFLELDAKRLSTDWMQVL